MYWNITLLFSQFMNDLLYCFRMITHTFLNIIIIEHITTYILCFKNIYNKTLVLQSRLTFSFFLTFSTVLLF